MTAPPKKYPRKKTSTRRVGRPSAATAPMIPWAQIEQEFVFGEVSEQDGHTVVRYPTPLELAQKFGLHNSSVQNHIEKGGWVAKRDALQRATEAKIREKTADLRSTTYVQRFNRLGDTVDLLERAVARALRRYDEPVRTKDGAEEAEPPEISSLDAKGFASALKQVADTQKLCAGVISLIDPTSPASSGKASASGDDEEEDETDPDAAAAYVKARMAKNQVPDDGTGGAE